MCEANCQFAFCFRNCVTWSGYIAFVAMATALARVAVAGFGQHSIRPQRALRVEAPENAGVRALLVGIVFDPDEHVFAAQPRAEIRTIRIKIVKFSHDNLLLFGVPPLGGPFGTPNEPPKGGTPNTFIIRPPAKSRV